jgi:hypothetical protein
MTIAAAITSLLWEDSKEVLYRNIAGAKQTCSEFKFTLPVKPGYSGDYGLVKFDPDGHVTVAIGFIWNGASGPTIDTSDTVCASLGHDVMYWLMQEFILPAAMYKQPADLWFYERLRTDGMPDLRAWYWYRAVMKFGVPKRGPDDVIHRAPIPYEVNKYQPIIPGNFMGA